MASTNIPTASDTNSTSTDALIYAVLHNQLSAAKTAIKQGANVNVKLSDGNHLLHVCLSDDMGKILLNNGAKINALNANQETPLLTAMRRGINDLTLLLINSGADVNAQDNAGTAALHLAQSTQINSALLGKSPQVNIQDNAGNTPVISAVSMKGPPILGPLLDAGADKNIRNNAGDNAYDALASLIARTEAWLTEMSNMVVGDPAAGQEASAKGSFFAFDAVKAQAKAVPAPEEKRQTLKP